MAKPTSDTDATIESLLQQRAQYEQWLARLDSAGDKAPPAVRARVRSDYEARLRGVIDQLRGFGAKIAEELDRHKGTQTGLDGERRQAEEARLAEAEVRHAVGEYSEDEWQRINDQSGELLGRLRGELRAVGDEIARLAEVQGLIGGAPKRVEPTPAGASPASTAGRGSARARTRARAICAAARRSRARRPVPRPSRRRESPRSRTARHQWTRLAFLKSVAPEERTEAAADLGPPGKQSRPVGGPDQRQGSRDGEPDGRTRKAGRRGRSEDAQVRGVRHAQPADGVVLRTLWGGAGGI